MSSETDPVPAPLRLLLQAVDALPTEERHEVLGYLLGSNLTLPAFRSGFPGSRSGLDLHDVLTRATAVSVPAGADQRMVPVRFPAEQHARLRAWCQEHGFSMAVVIRGLVERFLQAQRA